MQFNDISHKYLTCSVDAFVWWQVRCTNLIIITYSHLSLYVPHKITFYSIFESLFIFVYFFHSTHDTKLGHINNSRITLNYVCLQSWYTRKYNVKILILCALKICTLRPPQFFMYQPYAYSFLYYEIYVWLITGFIWIPI